MNADEKIILLFLGADARNIDQIKEALFNKDHQRAIDIANHCIENAVKDKNSPIPYGGRLLNNRG